MIADLVGNGPSKQAFLDSYDASSDHRVFGCNMGIRNEKVKEDGIFIIDRKVWLHITKTKHVFPPHTMLLTPRIRRGVIAPWCKNQTETFTLDGRYLSSGLCGAAFLLEQANVDHLHMWGFDSLFANTLETDTKEVIPKSTQADSSLRLWNEYFLKLKEKHNERITLHQCTTS